MHGNAILLLILYIILSIVMYGAGVISFVLGVFKFIGVLNTWIPIYIVGGITGIAFILRTLLKIHLDIK